jgi:threonine dehydratase
VILRNPEVYRGKRVGVIITGGNVDMDRLPWVVTGESAH